MGRPAGNPNGGAHVLTGVAEHLNDHVGRSVHHERLSGEVRGAIHQPVNLDQLLDPVEVTHQRAICCGAIERGDKQRDTAHVKPSELCTDGVTSHKTGDWEITPFCADLVQIAQPRRSVKPRLRVP